MIKVENRLNEFDSYIQSDVLLNVREKTITISVLIFDCVTIQSKVHIIIASIAIKPKSVIFGVLPLPHTQPWQYVSCLTIFIVQLPNVTVWHITVIYMTTGLSRCKEIMYRTLKKYDNMLSIETLYSNSLYF
jgi:hypothetical protein